jgi:hypothetical protein
VIGNGIPGHLASDLRTRFHEAVELTPVNGY